MSARFARPATLDEALPLLAAGGWSVLAGGTDLYPAHVGRPLAGLLVDITGIAGLRGIRRTAAGWSIGAATTWTDVLRADLPPLLRALQQAAREVGGVQIQNAGTVVGNLCNASPAADGTPVLMALGAEVVLRSADGERRVPVTEFVQGNRRTACAPHELVVAIEVPAHGKHARSVFIKLGGRRYLTISMTMVAVVLDADTSGVVTRAGVAVGSCSAAARRLPALEGRLIGCRLGKASGDRLDGLRDKSLGGSLESSSRHSTESATDGLAAMVVATDLAPLAPLDDLRASAAYRLDATATLLRRALAEIAAGGVRDDRDDRASLAVEPAR